MNSKENAFARNIIYYEYRTMEFAVTFSNPSDIIDEEEYKCKRSWIMDFSNQTRRPMSTYEVENMSVLPENTNIDINQHDKVTLFKSFELFKPDESLEETTEEPSDEPAEEVPEEPTEEPSEEPAEEVPEEPAEEVPDETAEEPSEKPAEEVPDETAEEPSEEPAEEVPDETAEEPSEEPAEATEEPSEEPAEEATEEPSEEPAEEVPEETSEEPVKKEIGNVDIDLSESIQKIQSVYHELKNKKKKVENVRAVLQETLEETDIELDSAFAAFDKKLTKIDEEMDALKNRILKIFD